MAVQDSKRRVALLTGVTGQDGAYLAEYLLGLGYTVHGVKRRSSSFNTARIDHLYEDPHAGDVPFLLHYGDMTDSTNLIRLMQQIRPTEIYNLAAQSHVGVSFESPEYTANADAIGVLGSFFSTRRISGVAWASMPKLLLLRIIELTTGSRASHPTTRLTLSAHAPKRKFAGANV